MRNINTISRVVVYNHEPRSLSQDKRRRRAARVRAAIVKATIIALIAAAVFMALASLSHAESVCNPQTYPACIVNPAPSMELNYRSFIPIAAR